MVQTNVTPGRGSFGTLVRPGRSPTCQRTTRTVPPRSRDRLGHSHSYPTPRTAPRRRDVTYTRSWAPVFTVVYEETPAHPRRTPPRRPIFVPSPPRVDSHEPERNRRYVEKSRGPDSSLGYSRPSPVFGLRWLGPVLGQGVSTRRSPLELNPHIEVFGPFRTMTDPPQATNDPRTGTQTTEDRLTRIRCRGSQRVTL